MIRHTILILILLIIALTGCETQVNDKQRVIDKEISNFEQCAAAGNPIMESYPRQCRANNQTFVEEIDGIFCTADAKECPDGSYVGRQPPTCEFAPCPGK